MMGVPGRTTTGGFELKPRPRPRGRGGIALTLLAGADRTG